MPAIAHAPPDPILARGVYRAPYLVDGVEVLVAIDSRGSARKHVKLRAGVDELRAKEWLEDLLDRIDPLPKIELVRESPAEERRAGGWANDRAYARHLAKRGAQLMRSRFHD
jgi:hypothetical protein